MPIVQTIVIDNFYENPLEVREFALKQQFMSSHLPRYHTKSFSNLELYNRIQNIVFQFAGKITKFYIPDKNNKFDDTLPDTSLPSELVDHDVTNGSFIVGLDSHIPWRHVDRPHEDHPNADSPTDSQKDIIDEPKGWAGLIYLTPFPPNNTGTLIVKPLEKTTQLNINIDTSRAISLDKTKWETIDTIGNVFNRLVLYRSNKQYHTADHNFGDNLENGRLTQLFFFDTEY